jgi:prophage tail gpP-like protein
VLIDTYDAIAAAYELPFDPKRLPTPKAFPINPGMTGAQLLEEMSRTTGALVWDNAKGELVISGVGTTRAGSPLIEGQNLEAANGFLTMDQRFSDYYVLGQSYDLGSGHINQFAHVTDPGVKRHRTRIIPWEAPDQDGAYSTKRAQWEAARRFGRSNSITVRVTGWRDSNGALWAPNSVVHVTSPACKIDRDLVITRVSWIRNGTNGTVALLTLMPKEGLVPQPLLIIPPVPGTAEPAPH